MFDSNIMIKNEGCLFIQQFFSDFDSKRLPDPRVELDDTFMVKGKFCDIS